MKATEFTTITQICCTYCVFFSGTTAQMGPKPPHCWGC